LAVAENNKLKNVNMNTKIEVKELPKMNLAFVSSIGPQNLEIAYSKLVKWATSQGLMNNQTKMLTIYHDSFKDTEANKVRMSASILINQPVADLGEIGLTSIQKGKFIVGNYEIGLNDFEKSWTALFLWMNENGFKKRDEKPFEMYHNNFNEHPERKSVVEFFIPII